MELRLIILFFLVRTTEQVDLVCNFRGQDAAAAAANPTDWAILYKKASSQEAYLHDSRSALAAWEDDLVDLTKTDISVGQMIETVRADLANHNVIAYSNFPPHARETIQRVGLQRWQWMAVNSHREQVAKLLLKCLRASSLRYGSTPSDLMDYQDPFIYHVSMMSGDNSLDKIASLKKLIEPSQPRVTPYAKNEEFKSADQTKPLKFRIISKLNAARQDIYSSYLPIVLKRNLLVWSEDKSARLLASSCTSKYKVENVNPKEIILESSTRATIQRKDDTSSWAISKGSNLFCVSNADRTEASKNVGAGVLCLENQNVHDVFKKIANKAGLQSCK
ncbi:hypothetical protein M513_01155 [Trichuris suis]|uniref:Uncharacterized protein n=1 Tax=Trichuris suis TaxID=68888 RepID=A0A085ML26_9BILA|nr:hypothetical protein M513_01155 [Trichuris suis]